MMKLTTTLIASVANTYTLEELQQRHADAVAAMLDNPDSIVSASTGAGASYTRQINARPAELVELYAAALAHKQGLPPSTGAASVHSFVFVR